MPEYGRSGPQRMECTLEKLIRILGFKLVYDGSKSNGLQLDGVEHTYFVRKYRLYVDGGPQCMTVKFFYDKRTGWADFQVKASELDEFERLMSKREKATKESNFGTRTAVRG